MLSLIASSVTRMMSYFKFWVQDAAIELHMSDSVFGNEGSLPDHAEAPSLKTQMMASPAARLIIGVERCM